MDEIERSANWQLKKIGEVAPIDNQAILPTEYPEQLFQYIALENIESGTGRVVEFVPTKGSSIKSNKFLFNTTHVLFGKLRPYLNKVVVPDFEGICSTDILPLQPNPEVLTREFLSLFLRSSIFIEFTKSKMEGTKMPRLRTPDLENFEIPIPPLPEQCRIVARIEELTRRVEEAKGLRREATDGAQSLFQRLLEREFSEESTESWKEMPADLLFKVVSGQVSPYDQRYSSLPYLGPEHIESGTGRLIGERLSVAQLKMKSSKYPFSPNHVVYSKIRPALRKVCLPSFAGLCSADMYALVPNLEMVSREFLFYMLLSPSFSEYAVDKSERNAMPKINREALLGFSFKVPESTEQRRIVHLLMGLRSKLDGLIGIQKETETELSAFTPALLVKAFRGEL
jgi:type I restriction enzyme S subunit